MKGEFIMDSTTEKTQPADKKGNNKLLMIVIVVVLFLAVVGFLMKSAANKASSMIGNKIGKKVAEEAINNATGGKADVDINGANVSVKTKEGSFSTGNKLPDDWPKDAPVYTGATVTYSGSSNPQTGESGFGAVLTTTDGSTKVVEFYKKELVSQGWTIASTQIANDTTVLGSTKDTRSLAVSIVEASGTTTITLGISEKKE